MKMTVKNLQFNLAPIKCIASDSDAKMPEDVNVDIDSEGASFGIDEITMEVSIAELGELCGHKAITTSTTTPVAAPTASTTSSKADEALDICRAIMHKIDDLKKSSTLAPSAPSTSRATKKAPAAPTVGKVTTNDEDEFI